MVMWIENELLNNGDGLYFINEDGVADGVQINIIVNDIVVPNTFKNIAVGNLFIEIQMQNSTELLKRK
jgi:putative protease